MAETEFQTRSGKLPGRFDGPSDSPSLIVLAHGAGAGMDSAFMDHIAKGLAGRGHRVARFEFPYMAAGRKAPDRGPVLEQAFSDVVEGCRRDGPHRSLIAGGKSLGGRIASQAAAAGMDVSALVFLGYPMHPPGRPDRMRDAHLRTLQTPMLFVEGTRDPFCPLPTLQRVLSEWEARAELSVIEDGDHSFKVRRSSGRTTADAWDEVIGAVDAWIRRLFGPPAA